MRGDRRLRRGWPAAGDGYRAIGAAAHRHPARRAEAVIAAMDRRASRTGGDARLTQHGDAAALPESALERAQFGVDAVQGRELGGDQGVVTLSEAVQIEDESAEIAVSELPCLEQKMNASADAPAVAEPGALVLGGDVQTSDQRRTRAWRLRGPRGSLDGAVCLGRWPH